MLASACSGSSREATPLEPERGPVPRVDPSPPDPASPPDLISPPDAAEEQTGRRAREVARYIEDRWPRVQISRPSADPKGVVVSYAILADYDGSIDDPDAYAAHVRRLTGDLRQASVELLQMTVKNFPNLRYASVWEDVILQAFWSKDQILELGPASSYRDFHTFHRLLASAEIPPPLLRRES